MSPTNILSGVRAVICDVYGTLLQVGPPSRVAATVFETLFPIFGGRNNPKDKTTMSLADFNARCEARIAAENESRRLAGEPWPEVNFLNIIRAVTNNNERYASISVLHAHCTRRCTAMPGSLRVIKALRARGVKCGLASNAQFYTFLELGNAGFHRKDFVHDLRFISGDHGFSKPSPRVFSVLTARLAAHSIAPHQTLMVGDSLENDVVPAAAAGWRTWHIGPRTWDELLSLLPPPEDRVSAPAK